MKVTNDSGQSGPVYLYLLGVDLNSDKLGYVNASGKFTPWALPGGKTPVPAPDVSIQGPSSGDDFTINVPKNLSGRLYFSFGQKLSFSLVDAGLVQPAPWNSSDENSSKLFDWSEFTYNNAGLWLNSSQVDQFAVPHEVNVTDQSGKTTKTGNLVNGGREKVIELIKKTPGYSKTVMTDGNGDVLRVLAPGKATDAGLMDEKYLDPYIDEAWAAYSSKTLTIVPFEDQPSIKFFGKTSGNTMSFTNTSGAQVATFTKPSTSDVWDCDGNILAPNDLTAGPIARTLCSALQRGTMGTSSIEPVSDASKFYKRSLTNHYSAIIHDHMVDGKAYGFAFDDVTHQESLVHSGSPTRAGVVLKPFGKVKGNSDGTEVQETTTTTAVESAPAQEESTPTTTVETIPAGSESEAPAAERPHTAGTPSGLRATTVTPSHITLKWDAVPGAKSYTIYRAGVPIATSKSNTFNNDGLIGGRDYLYSVSATTSGGNSAPSPMINIRN